MWDDTVSMERGRILVRARLHPEMQCPARKRGKITSDVTHGYDRATKTTLERMYEEGIVMCGQEGKNSRGNGGLFILYNL